MKRKVKRLLILALLLSQGIFSFAESNKPYEGIDGWDNGMRRVYNYGQVGVIDEEGEFIIPFVSGFDLMISGEYILLLNQNSDIKTKILTKENEEIYSSDTQVVYYYDGEHSILSRFTGTYSEDPDNPYEIWEFAIGDKNFNPISEFEYSYIQVNKEHNFSYLFSEKDGKYGVIDWNGNVILPTEYDWITSLGREFNETVCVIRKDNKYGLFDGRTGKIVADCKYDNFSGYGSGLIAMQHNGKWGYLNDRGETVIQFQYDRALEFISGYAHVIKNGKSGLIDPKGSYVIPCEYDYISGFAGETLTYGNSTSSYELIHPYASRDINIYKHLVWSDEREGINYWIYSDQEPFIEKGRTMVPIRVAAEYSGYNVKWVEDTKEIILFNEAKVIKLTIGSNIAIVNNFDDGILASTVVLDAPAKIVGGRTVVPLRFLAEHGGKTVIWENEQRNVIILD